MDRCTWEPRTLWVCRSGLYAPGQRIAAHSSPEEHLRPQVWPMPCAQDDIYWECRILATGPPGKSQYWTLNVPPCKIYWLFKKTSINISFFFFLNWSLRLVSEHFIRNSNFLSPSSLHLMNRMHSVIQLTQFLRVGNTLCSFFSILQVIDAQKCLGSERINKKAVFP